MTGIKMIKKIIKKFFFHLAKIKQQFLLNEKIIFNELKIIIYARATNKRILSLNDLSTKKLFILKEKSKDSLSGINYYLIKQIPSSNADLIFYDKSVYNQISKVKVKPNFKGYSLFHFIFSRQLFYTLKSSEYYFHKIKYFKGYFLLILKKNTHTQNEYKTRRYIPFNFSRVDFLKYLKKEEYNSVLLRWFDDVENLGGLEEDLDILIDDNDISRFNNLCNSNIGIYPIDVYSVSGLSGSDFNGLPYFTKNLSLEILNNKILSKEGFYIPNSIDYLNSIVYHALYHKGVKSSIPFNSKSYAKEGDHNYKEIILKALTNNNMAIPEVDMNNLYKYLNKFSYNPSYDLLVKYSQLKKGQDPWLNSLIQFEHDRINKTYPFIEGICVFLIREKAFTTFFKIEIEKCLNKFGFEIVKEGEIENIANIAPNLRGGNWGKGPFKISGGLPVYFYIAYDPFVVVPGSSLKKKYPNLENTKIYSVKSAVRRVFRINNNYFNGLHSSDNYYEAIVYLEQILNNNKSQIHKLLELINKKKSIYTNPYEVLEHLTRNANRAKVELINYNNQKAVCKTYKMNKLDFLENEFWFLNCMSETEFVPKILEKGNNYIITEYFENAISLSSLNHIDVRLANQLKLFLEIIYNKNITILDLNPSNVLLHKNQLKFIDFEFAQPYKVRPPSLMDSYEMSYIPKDFEGEVPVGSEKIIDAYDFYWKDKIGKTKLFFF
jgi:hypothetical protein